MTQFLLLKTRAVLASSNLECIGVRGNTFLEPIALRLFRALDDVFEVRQRGWTMGQIVDVSIGAMVEGTPYSETPIFALLESLMQNGDALAFFWASYPDDLPEARSAHELHAIVENQLRDPTSMNEVYVRWERA